MRSRKSARKPFAKSQKNAAKPQLRPSTRPTLVAPMLPLPCWRTSMPRALAHEVAGRERAQQVKEKRPKPAQSGSHAVFMTRSGRMGKREVSFPCPDPERASSGSLSGGLRCRSSCRTRSPGAEAPLSAASWAFPINGMRRPNFLGAIRSNREAASFKMC